MSVTLDLDPDLLRACAAYLAHADAYCLDGDGQMALLRDHARSVVATRGFSAQHFTPPDKACDELTHAHIEAIRRRGRLVSFCLNVSTGKTQEVSAGVVPIARAILDATPSMLAWWCSNLGPS